MNQQNPISTHEDYMTFVVAMAEKHGMFAYEVHPHVHEIGSETVPYFRLMWHAEQASPMISFHIETRNSDAIQYYASAKNMCPNLILGESYYTTYNGETFVGEDADIANQMDREGEMTETTTQTVINEAADAAILIVNTPIYHAEDPKAKEQARLLRKRKGFGRFNG